MSSTTAAINLHYAESGEGTPVVLLHGLGSRGSDWQLQVPVLSKAYRVVAPDLRGHGASPKPPGPYSLPQMAADVELLLDTLKLDRVHLIGLSMGGMIGFQLATHSPERLRSLIVVNSIPDMVPRTGRQRLLIFQRLALATLTQPGQTGRFLSKRLFPKPEQQPLRDRFVAEWSENDKAAYLASMKALVGWSVLDRVQTIACPVLVVGGDRDYTPAESKESYARLIPGARTVTIEDSGHATPIDQPDRFNQTVLEFLSRLPVA